MFRIWFESYPRRSKNIGIYMNHVQINLYVVLLLQQWQFPPSVCLFLSSHGWSEGRIYHRWTTHRYALFGYCSCGICIWFSALKLFKNQLLKTINFQELEIFFVCTALNSRHEPVLACYKRYMWLDLDCSPLFYKPVQVREIYSCQELTG